MRLRYALLSATVACGTLIVPLAAPAQAVTTTSTLVAYLVGDEAGDVSQVFTAPADGSAPGTALTNIADYAMDAAVSPDGTKVAYSEYNDVTGGVYVRNANGTGTALLLAEGSYGSPAWSQDGTKIAMTSFDVVGDPMGEDFDITTTIVVAPAGGGTLVPIPDSTHDDLASFSPSGEQVAVFSDSDTYFGIDVVTVATGARAHLAGTSEGMSPAWSPDGQTIAFETFDFEGCDVAIATVPTAGGTRTTIRGGAGRSASRPRYSRDGSQLFWSEYSETCDTEMGDPDLWVGAADGTGAAAIAVTPTVAEYGVSVGGGPAATPDTTAPAAPVIAAAGTIAATSAKISWTSSSPDATGFKVVRVAHGAPAPATPADGVLGYDGPAHSATVTGLTTGTAYDLYVFAVDASGNVSLPSALHAARPTAPPVLNAMGDVALLSANNTFPVKWTGTAAAYQVNSGSKTRSSTGVWSTNPVYKNLVTSTTAKSVNFTGAQGTSYFFQVKGMDGFGNTTAYSAAKSASVPLDERYYAASYSAGWTSASGAAGRWLGTVRYTTAAGKTMTGTFETSSYQIIGDKCATCGKFEVWVDGVKKATIDSYATSTKTRQPLYTSGFYGSV
jgi:Tol biopolymer transport system component